MIIVQQYVSRHINFPRVQIKEKKKVRGFDSRLYLGMFWRAV
jgi:hypothetical protein